MDAVDGKFQSISQRVASTYCRMLADRCPVLPDGFNHEQQVAFTTSQTDLHAFFQALYAALYAVPGSFGLPVSEDAFLLADHSKEGPSKEELNRLLNKPRKLVSDGLEFLRSAAVAGRLEDNALLLEPGSPALAYLKKKPGRAWVQGMGCAGLALAEAGGGTILTNPRFPKMMPALKSLAEACAACKDPNLGGVFFARCDFRAIRQDFSVDALDLFRVFRPEDRAWAAELHDYFTGRGYQAQAEIGRMFSWTVKYQGKKSIKSTPLFQVEFDERLQWQIRAGIKCASAQRVAPLVTHSSQTLQDDFASRSNVCGDCHWCANQKTLGPVEYEYQGQMRKICWYVSSDIVKFTGETIGLVQEYAQLHEQLA